MTAPLLRVRIAAAALALATAAGAAGIELTRPRDLDEAAVNQAFARLANGGEVASDSALGTQRAAALGALNTAADARESAAALRQQANDAEARAARLERDIDRARAALERGPAAAPAGEDLAEALATAEAAADQARHALEEAESKLRDLQGAPVRLRDRITAIEQRARSLEAELAETDTGALASAEDIVAVARLKASNARLQELQAQLSTLEPRTRLANLARDLAALRQERAAADLAALRDATAALAARDLDAARAARAELRKRRPDGTPTARAVHARTLALADEKVETLLALGTHRDTLQAARSRARGLDVMIDSARQRVALSSSNPALAVLLRDERQQLGNPAALRQAIRARRRDIDQVSLRQIELHDRLRQSVTERTEVLLDSATGTPPARNRLRAAVREQQLLRRELSAGYTELLKVLSELDLVQNRIADQLDTHREFLDRHLLWLPSARPLNPGVARDALRATGWLGEPRHLAATWAALADDFARFPLYYLLAIMTMLLYPGINRRLRAMVDSMSERIRKARSDRFGYTLASFAAVLASSAVIPAVLLFGGWRLGVSAVGGEFVLALGGALQFTAKLLFPLNVLRRVCRTEGLAERHFRWQPDNCRRLRAGARLATLVLVPTLFAVVLFDLQANPDHRESAGRLALMLAALGLGYLARQLLNPSHGLPADYLEEHPDGWLANFRVLWYLLVLLLPVGLALAAAAGYQYTAFVLLVSLLASAGIIAAAAVVQHLCIRWLFVVRRRLRLQMALERQQKSDADEEDLAEEAAFDLLEIDSNSRQLVRVLVAISALAAIWMTWGGILPALDVFGDVELWHYQETLGEEIIDQVVSLQDVLVAAGLTLLFALGARDIPAVVHIGLLRRLPLSAGSRYATRALLQYLIVGIGIAVVFSRLGFSWSQVQWLIAALGVGLGFGLQEIFANFVSGLIILFERPIRVGDLVTVDNITGTVERIKIRATTLRDWDNKEVLVPNKTFLTTQVVNWTLSDPVTRVIVPVGVSYGDDTDATIRIIMNIARNNALVRKDPEPVILFRGLGDSSLDFELWVYVNAFTDRMRVTHELLLEIERELPKQGITIPFPQRDVYIKQQAAPEQRRGQAHGQPQSGGEDAGNDPGNGN